MKCWLLAAVLLLGVMQTACGQPLPLQEAMFMIGAPHFDGYRDVLSRFDDRLQFDFAYKGRDGNADGMPVVDTAGIKANRVKKLTVAQVSDNLRYTFLFDSAGRIVELAGSLRRVSTDGPHGSADTLRDRNGNAVAIVKQDGRGWGVFKVIYDHDGRTVLTVMDSYLDGLLQATDSAFFVQGPENASEADADKIVCCYRSGRFLREQQRYFNEQYLNQNYRSASSGYGFFDASWKPEDDFCYTYYTTDSLYFTRPLSVTFTDDSLYHSRQIGYCGHAVVEARNVLPVPAFNEPYIYVEWRSVCGNGTRRAAMMQQNSFRGRIGYLPNGLPQEAALCGGMGRYTSCTTLYRMEYEYFN